MLCAAHRGRFAFLTRAGREPSRPVGPPAALVLRGALEPLLRAARVRVLDLPRPVGAFAPWRIDDARDVTAGGEHEPHVAPEQLRDAPSGVPRYDVVLFRPDRVGVEANAAEIDRHALKRDFPGFDQIVL